MLAEALLYLELLAFLAGTLLYGYLARQLLFQPKVLPGNWALRGVVLALLVFYGGTLLDQQLFLLFGPQLDVDLGIGLDLLRGSAWLLVFPLLAQALGHSAAELGRSGEPGIDEPGLDEPGLDEAGIDESGVGSLPLGLLLFLPWASLALFWGPFWSFVGVGDPTLGLATQRAYGRIVAHTALGLSVSAYLAGHLAARLWEARAMGRLLRGLQAMLLALLVFFLGTLAIEPWAMETQGSSDLQLLMRTAVMTALLFPGGLFAIFVRRYNVLRLSLSFRTLRHFLGVLVLVLLLMAAGPALGLVGVDIYRQVVAWGLLVAVGGGLFYAPVADALLRRSAVLRQLFGRSLSPPRLEALMDRLQNLDLPPSEVMRVAARELGEELSVEAEFLAEDDAEAAPFWRHFSEPESSTSSLDSPSPAGPSPPPPRHRRPVHRLDPGPMAGHLARGEMQAVFPLWVAGRLEGILALRVPESSPLAGGLDDGELEAVALVLRQLGAILVSSQRLEMRLGEERRLAEQERLGMLGLVAASLAHEVKNPLSSIKILAQALREDLADSRQGESFAEGIGDLDAILEQIDRLDHTTHEILGLARPRPGTQCDLTALVGSAVYILAAEARRRGVDLVSHLEPVGQVPGSPAAWQTVVFNLISNAIHHTPAGTTVSVDLTLDSEAPGEPLRLRVENPAPALDEGSLDHLFEPFASSGGTGLGLALVARRAQELGVDVEGRAEGGKAIFRVCQRAAKPERKDNHE